MSKTLQREIHLARNIQSVLLNGEKPDLERGEVSGVSIPARLIGGDYFDFYPLADGKLRIVIGDVMGKGIPAAMLMILTRGAFRSGAIASQGPGETLTAMNNAMFSDLRKLGSFVTVFCADWHPGTGEFVYANAGHAFPIFIRGTEEMKIPVLKGVMLGGLPDTVYQEEKLFLQKDDLVFFYTDGIVEARNANGEMFKLERLTLLLAEFGQRTAEEIKAAVIDRVNAFTDGLAQKDDITMVVLKTGNDQAQISSLNIPLSIG